MRSRAYLVASLLHRNGAGRVLLAQVGGRGRLAAREGHETSRSRSPCAPARGDRTTPAHGLGVPLGAQAVGAGREALRCTAFVRELAGAGGHLGNAPAGLHGPRAKDDHRPLPATRSRARAARARPDRASGLHRWWDFWWDQGGGIPRSPSDPGGDRTRGLRIKSRCGPWRRSQPPKVGRRGDPKKRGESGREERETDSPSHSLSHTAPLTIATCKMGNLTG